MQFDLLRAFPYPVLRPRVNDYVEGDIQANVDFEPQTSDDTLKASVRFVVSVPEIVRLIEAGDAAYVVVFACRDTYFSHSLRGGFQNSRASLLATRNRHAAWSRDCTMKPSRS